MLVLSVSNLEKHYGGHTIFETLSWQVQKGSKVGLVGPNGVGKSTLFKLLAGEMKPDGGAERAAQFLAPFDTRQLVHGHTPIDHVLQCPAELVAWPLIYANGLCVNIDGGMYRGGPGFIYQLEAARC